MNSMDENILNELTDEDIQILCKNADLDMMMAPIKYNGKQYAKYVAQVGRLDKKSVLAQKNLPRIAFELYRKGDRKYYEIIAITAENTKKLLKKMLNEFMGNKVKPQDLQVFTIDDYKKLFAEVVKSADASLDLDLFFLQIRMYAINISGEMRAELKNEWSRWEEIRSFIKELLNKEKEEAEKKETELSKLFTREKEELKNKVAELQKEINLLQVDIDSKNIDIAALISKNESMYNEEKRQVDVIKSKDTEIDELKLKLNEVKENFSDINEKLNTKENDIYREVQALWQKENEKKLNESKKLEDKIFQYLKNINELEERSERLKSKIKEWDGYIETYFDKIDQKIIEHSIDSILYQKCCGSFSEVAAVSGNIVKSSPLYIEKGYKVANAKECKDYEEYIEIVETNLSIAGDKMQDSIMSDCFNSAIDAGLHPLICGFGARHIALALIAARYAEKSEIISLPVGFNNTQELVTLLSNVQTNSIIIEDAFGTMNENLLLPILRDTNGKIVILTTESTESLKYLQKHFYNYIQLIAIDRYTNSRVDDFTYSNADKLFNKQFYSGNERGHKLARFIFNGIGADSAYVLRRGNILCELIDENKGNSEEEALNKLFMTELKWINNEEDAGVIEENIQKIHTNK